LFGISVKPDISVDEENTGCMARGWNGYRFCGVEVNSSASWTSPVAFQELELITQVLLHNYRIRVNRNCALRFHVGNGLRPLDAQTVKRTAALLWCLYPIACHVHPPQRRRGQHSVPIREHSALAINEQVPFVLENEKIFKEGLHRQAKNRGFCSNASVSKRAHPSLSLISSGHVQDDFGGP